MEQSICIEAFYGAFIMYVMLELIIPMKIGPSQ
jgi:hypothetical protein